MQEPIASSAIFEVVQSIPEAKIKAETQERVESPSSVEVQNPSPTISTSKISKPTKPLPDLESRQDVKFAEDHFGDKYSEAIQSLSRGYTRLPNEVLVKVMNGDIGQREIRILMAILRLSAGFGKTWVSVSGEYLNELTSIPLNHLYKSIKVLVEKGLIEKKVQPDQKTKRSANIYRILFDGKNSYLDYSSEEDGLSEKTVKYLDSILVKAQKEIERKAIYELTRNGLSQNEILEGIEILLSRGLPNSGEKVNSPAAYLSKSGSRIFEEIRKRKTREQKASNDTFVPQNDDTETENEFGKIESEFELAFPDQRERELKITELINTHRIMGSGSIQLPYVVARKIALQKWSDEFEGLHSKGGVI